MLGIEKKLSSELLYSLYVTKNLSDREIGDLYNCSDVTISNLRKRYNIKTKSQFDRLLQSKNKSYPNINQLTDEEFNQYYLNNTLEEFALKFGCSTLKIKNDRKKRGLKSKILIEQGSIASLTEYQKIIVTGSLLGDGGVYFSGKETAFYKESHAISQDLYLKKIYIDLLPLSLKIFYDLPKKGEKEIGFKTKATKEFKIMRDIFYIDNQKIIPLSYLKNNWNNGYIAFWYFGDGELKDNYPIINTAFNENLKEFVNFLNEKENLDIVIKNYPSMTGMNFLRIRNKDNFFNIIKKYITPDMLYKIPIEFLNQISEETLKEFRNRAILGYDFNIKKYKSRLFHLLSEDEKELWIDQVFKYYRTVGFPYIKIYDEQWDYKLNNFKKATIKEINGILEFKTQGLDICKFFMPHIYKANYKNYASPFNSWLDDLNLKKLILNRFNYAEGVNHSPMRTGIDLMFRTVANFKPMVARWICDNFDINDYVYLPDAGYGGKLLGTLFSKINNIISLDPNSETFEASLKMIEKININKNIQIIKNCSEKYCPLELKNKIGLVLSCPPYFDLEKYSEEQTQSIKQYPLYEIWRENFLKKTIENIYDLLVDKGYYAIVLNNYENYNLIEDFFILCDNKFGLVAKYYIPLGSIYNKKENKHITKYENLFILQKNSIDKISRKIEEKIIKKSLNKDYLFFNIDDCVKKINALYNQKINTSRKFLKKNFDLFPYSTSTIEKKFDSWNNFLIFAGLPLNKEFNSSKQKIIDYRSVCLKYGRILSFYELDRLENIPSTRYKRMFNKTKPYFHLKDDLKNYVFCSDIIFNNWLELNFSDEDI